VPQFPLELQGPKRILWWLELFNYTYSTLSAKRNLLIAVDCYAVCPQFAMFCPTMHLAAQGTLCPIYELQVRDYFVFNNTFSCSKQHINFKNICVQMMNCYNQCKITHHSLMENILRPHKIIKTQSPFSYWCNIFSLSRSSLLSKSSCLLISCRTR